MKEKEDSNNKKFIFEDEEDDLDSLKKLDEHDMEEEVSCVKMASRHSDRKDSP